MSFPPVGSATSYQPYTQSLSFNLEDMLEKAKAYAKRDEELLGYIQNILNNREFQANPKGYLDNWTKQRGDTEEYRLPEDRARGFFNEHFKF